MRSLILLLLTLGMSHAANAQISVSLNFNVEHQPMWGPTGYDYVEYYYMPDIEVYYYVPGRMFFYYEGGRWISGNSLPNRFRSYDLYSSYKIVVNEKTPYRRHAVYRDRYYSYKGRHDQQFIRDSRDKKYFGNKNHPEYKNRPRKQQQEKNSGPKKESNDKRKRK